MRENIPITEHFPRVVQRLIVEPRKLSLNSGAEGLMYAT